MYIQSFQNAAASKITVTGTATNIFDLVNTAGSTTEVNAGFSSRANAILLQPEDGDIRVLFNGQVPTATNGFLIKADSIAYLPNVPLKSLKLIRVSGSVVCSIQIGISDASESVSVTGSGGEAISSVIPGTGATNLGKAEDAVHASGDTGVFALNVRKDTAVSTAGTDGDYAGDISNSTGHKWIAEGFAPQYEDNTLAIAKMGVKGVATRMSTATTTTAKTGAGVLNRITINKAVLGTTITVYDNTAASGTILALITFGAALLSDPPITALYDIAFATGCTVITSGTVDITISTT